MSQLIARILLSVFVVPIGLLAFACSVALFENSGLTGPDRALVDAIGAGFVTWLVAGGYWTVIWFRTVRWTSQRITMTLISIPAAVAVGFVITIAVNAAIDREVGSFFGALIGPMVWLIATIFLWQETGAERAAKISAANVDALTCPNCGYNLTGLTEARCPECGSTFTLNDLYARQPQNTRAAEDREMAG